MKIRNTTRKLVRVKYKSLHLTQNRNCKELDVNEENFFYSFYHGQVPTVQQYKICKARKKYYFPFFVIVNLRLYFFSNHFLCYSNVIINQSNPFSMAP